MSLYLGEDKINQVNIGLPTNNQYKTANPSTVTNIVTYDSGYTGLGSVTINAIQTETVEITPTTTSQSITPSIGKFISRANVSAVTSSIDPNIISDNIKENVTILGVTGSLVEGIPRKILNDDSIAPTGTYATSTYYNTDYGVKIGYMNNGDIILSMQGGTSTAYEYLYFNASSLPSGVTLTAATSFTRTSYTSGAPSNIYACVLSGFTGYGNIAIDLSTRNSTYDYTQADITLTAT